jgi:hypothetical protein
MRTKIFSSSRISSLESFITLATFHSTLKCTAVYVGIEDNSECKITSSVQKK